VYLSAGHSGYLISEAASGGVSSYFLIAISQLAIKIFL
jgi:ABC-type transport system involved in cytochrome bd biosynthesis fused ATPase/permease subunit